MDLNREFMEYPIGCWILALAFVLPFPVTFAMTGDEGAGVLASVVVLSLAFVSVWIADRFCGPVNYEALED
jgi:hypothetical protein